jgi:hypothetical protein
MKFPVAAPLAIGALNCVWIAHAYIEVCDQAP